VVRWHFYDRSIGLKLLFDTVERVFGQGTIGPIRLLARDSMRVLLGRLRRLRATAASMSCGSLTPPLPVRVQIETVDVCNLKCRMCSREILEGMNSSIMPFGQFRALIDEAQPFYVTMNGLGEPLMDKSLFSKLAFLRDRNIMTAMPSNGTFINKDRRDLLAANMPDVLQLSIDGATKESFEYIRAGSNFEQIIKHYRAIVQLHREGRTRPGTRIRVLCALQRRNLSEFREMLTLLRSMPGISGFELVPVFNYDAEGGRFNDLVPSADEVRSVHRELEAAIAGSNDDEERQFFERWKHVSTAWLQQPQQAATEVVSRHACIVPWYNTYVDAKGRVYPCCYLLTTGHVMGNVNSASLASIWHGDKYREFRRQLMTARPTLEGCRTCPRNDDSRIQALRRLGLHLGSRRTGAAPLLPAPQAATGFDGTAANTSVNS
jgi:radical SAM protein with 4Fe4S-binding SPASM domain